MNDNVLIQIRGAAKVFKGDIRALNNVDLDIHEGDRSDYRPLRQWETYPATKR